MERHLYGNRGEEWVDIDVAKCIVFVERKVCISDSFYFLCEVRPKVNCWEEEAESEVELRQVENSCLRNVMRWPENVEDLHIVANWKLCYSSIWLYNFPRTF